MLGMLLVILGGTPGGLRLLGKPVHRFDYVALEAVVGVVRDVDSLMCCRFG